MIKNLFQYESYRQLIEGWIKSEADAGCRTRLAQAAKCNPSWITRVLSGSAHFTPDQAHAISQLFDLNERETDYFLLLVERERAATPALQERIAKKLKALSFSGREVGSSVKTDSEVSENHRLQYYSTWLYAALHVACMLHGFRVSVLAARLRLNPETVQKALDELLRMGLVTNQSGDWRSTSKSVHLPFEHPMASFGHVHWRYRTIQQLQEGKSGGLHYSGVHHLSSEDVEVVRRKLKNAVLSCRSVIEKSKADTLAVFCLDWYEL